MFGIRCEEKVPGDVSLTRIVLNEAGQPPWLFNVSSIYWRGSIFRQSRRQWPQPENGDGWSWARILLAAAFVDALVCDALVVTKVAAARTDARIYKQPNI